MKVCTGCDQEKSADEFYARASYCKCCVRARARRNYHANRERRLELQRRYREERRAELAEKQRNYRRDHLDERRAYDRRYAEKNADRVYERVRAWQEANPERAAEQQRRHRRRHADHYREAGRLNMRRRSLGRDEDAIEYAEVLAGDPCAYCGESSESVDHIEAVARAGANAWSNLTAACSRCNSQKGTRPLLHFLLT